VAEVAVAIRGKHLFTALADKYPYGETDSMCFRYGAAVNNFIDPVF
jgi:hypothetical protein